MAIEWNNNLLKYLIPTYFIFNYYLLPIPLTWVNIGAMLTILIWWKKSFNKATIAAFLIFSIYSVIHYLNGVNIEYYIRSSALIINLPLTALALRYFLLNHTAAFKKGMEVAVWASSVLFIIGLLIYYSPYSSILWSSHDFIGDGDTLLRFNGLSYEPSHYALVLTPLFAYYFISFALYRTKKALILLAATSIPIAATLSFGFAAAFFSTILLLLIPILMDGRLKKMMIGALLIGIVTSIAVASADEMLSQRIDLVMKGKDTSVNGRTWQAFYLAYKCAEERSVLFGIGQGQVKVIGEEVIRPYYQKIEGYSKEDWPVLALPNSAAETLAMYGVIGLIIKLFLIAVLFYKMKVYKNWFQLFIFVFIFVYQLMGSFFLSVAEILIWVLAFSPIFPEFDIRIGNQKKAVE